MHADNLVCLMLCTTAAKPLMGISAQHVQPLIKDTTLRVDQVSELVDVRTVIRHAKSLANMAFP